MVESRRTDLANASDPSALAVAPAPRGRGLVRWAPLIAVATALGIGYALGLQDYFSLDALRRYQESLSGFVAAHAVATAAAYVLIYVVAVALSFPGASFLTIAGGFMFGAAVGTALAVIAASFGATLIFLIARTSIGDLLAERAGPRTRRLREGFQEEGFSYLLFLRLVPLFPFWLVNLAAALFGMRVLPYVAATAIGILPGTFVFSYFGAGLRTALAAQGPPVSLELFVGLALLGVLALVPAIVRRWRRGKDQEQGASS
jgi:uncharacterized membrane protein YdjX (TVP38/TMEM64 family)